VKFLLVSIVLTAIFLILYTNFVNTSVSAKDIAIQNYNIIKDLVIKIFTDFSRVLIELFKIQKL
jgi:hypothetical protein